MSFIKKGIGKILEIGKLKKGSKKGEVELEPTQMFCKVCGCLLKKEEDAGNICITCKKTGGKK